MDLDKTSIGNNEFTNTTDIINNNLVNKVTSKKQNVEVAELANQLENFKLPEVSTDKPAVILDYNNKSEEVKVGYMSELVNDKDLVDIASEFYYYKDGIKFETPEQAIKYWMTDRTWKQTNIPSMGLELAFVTDDDVPLKQLQNLKYLTEKWDSQPMFFRGAFNTIYQNLKPAVADPLNWFGGDDEEQEKKVSEAYEPTAPKIKLAKADVEKMSASQLQALEQTNPEAYDAALKASQENDKKVKEQANKAMADSQKSVNTTDGGNMQVALLQEQNELLRALLRTTKSNTSDMYSSA